MKDYDVEISEVSIEDIKDLMIECDELEKRKTLSLDYYDNHEYDGILVLKKYKANKKSIVIQMVIDKGIVYRERYGKVYSTTRIDLKRLIENTLLEE